MYACTRACVGGLVTGWFRVRACSHVVSKMYRYMGGKERERATIKEGGGNGVREEMRKDSFVSSA